MSFCFVFYVLKVAVQKYKYILFFASHGSVGDERAMYNFLGLQNNIYLYFWTTLKCCRKVFFIEEREENTLEKRNGITLIALVITIIVMLILAGVTISALIGQGNIIENSKNAVGKYNNRVIEEQEILNKVIEYINNSGSIEETGISISVVADTTEVTKKVIVTVEGNAEEGIKSFTSTLGDNKTYVEGTKEIVETCEITENGIYIFTIEDNKGKTANKGILIEI